MIPQYLIPRAAKCKEMNKYNNVALLRRRYFVMRLLKIFLAVFVLSNLVFCSLSTNNEVVRKKQEKSKVIKIFRQAISLDEEFAKSHGKKRLEVGERIRRFDDEELSWSLSTCSALLSSGQDIDLAIHLCNLIVGLKHSANEEPYFTLGEIFLHNPDLITEALNKFEGENQKFLYGSLEWGWGNVFWGEEIPEAIEKDRKKRLNQLQTQILGDEPKTNLDLWLKK